MSGSREAVEDLVSAYTQQEVLGDVLIRRDCSLTCYYTSNDTKILTRTRGGITLDVKQAVVDEDRCHGCGNCVTHCPTGAIKMKLVRPASHIKKLEDVLQNMGEDE